MKFKKRVYTPLAASTPTTQIMVSNSVLQWKELGERMFAGVGQRIYKVILENLVMPETKGVLKKEDDEGMSKWHRVIERAFKGQNWNNLHNKINNIILDYNPNTKQISMSPYWY